MTRVLLFLVFAAAPAAAEFAVARPGYDYRFPRDHFAHPEFKTEWWYWTGNLRDASGRRFGFELTFFRQALTAEPASGKPWDLRDLYLAHFTVSDIAGKRFLHFERLNRAGPGLAGADAERERIWNGNWQASLDSLSAITESLRLQLKFRSAKAPVIHGVNGISRKDEGEGRASHYVSFTRLETTGTLELDGRTYAVTGSSWMDHEFFTHQLSPGQVGWDWMSIQLNNGTELMLFRMRRRDGSIDRYSAGTFVDAAGKARHLEKADFQMEPLADSTWRSPASGAAYPLKWRIRVPSLQLELNASTPLDNQELVSKSGQSPTYWEGAMDYAGIAGGAAVRGIGYLEMTGYDKPIRLGEP